MKASLTLPVMALLTVKETTGMHRAHLLRCANGQRCSAGFLIKKMSLPILPAMAVMPVSNKAMQMDG